MAKLVFRFGTMGNGKSTHLLVTAHQMREQGQSVILLKPNIDTRDGAQIKSRVGLAHDCLFFSKTDSMIDVIKHHSTHLFALDHVIIDESQFLTAHQVEELGYVVDHLHVDVICYGLRTDFRTKLFTGSMRLFELADEIEDLKFFGQSKMVVNARMNADGQICTSGDQVQVGYNYKPITRREYFENLWEE